MKPISHFERKSQPLSIPISLPRNPARRKTRVTTIDEVTGIHTTKCKIVSYDRVEEMKPYRVSDFSLDNLIAIGANLDDTHLSASPHRAITDMERTLSNININNEEN